MSATRSQFDCVILGGSYSGLQAALVLGRSLRSVVVIDDGLPCNRFAPHSHNFLTHDGETPAAIAALGRQQIQDNYKTVQFYQGRASTVTTSSSVEGTSTFQVSTEGGDEFEAKKLIFSTGVTDQLPDIPGVAECWGKSAIHCPYCHGFEFHSEPTGLFLNSIFAMHVAPMVRNLTPNLTLFSSTATDGESAPEFTDEQLASLAANDIDVISTPIKEIQHENGSMTAVVLEDGNSIPMKALYCGFPFELNCRSMMESLGCEINEHGYLGVDMMQKTNVPGVFGCGDSTTRFRALSYAVNSGNLAGMAANVELCASEFSQRGVGK